MTRLVKSIIIGGKVNDMGYYAIFGQNEERLAEIEGYGPHIGSVCDDSYIEIEIDLTTGQVVGFVPPTDKELAEMFDEAGTITDSKLSDILEG